MMALLDYGYNQYESKILFNKGNVMKTLKLNDSDGKINLVLEEDLVIVNKKGESNNKVTYDLEINDVSYPIKKGDVLGKVVLKNNGNFVSEVNLVSDMNINKASIFKMYLGVLSDMFSGSI